MIKILHFITDTNIGGAGNLLCNQIKNINTDEFSVTVALPQKSDLIKRLAPLPCSLIKCKSSADTSFSFAGIKENIKIIQAIEPDIVHSHASLSSRIAATLLGIPCRIFTRHCVFPVSPIYQNPLVKWGFRTANDIFSTSVITVAESARKNLLDMGVRDRMISTVINGTEPMRELPPEEIAFLREKYGLSRKNFVVSIFARLEEYKGQKTFLKAAKICKKYYPDFRFFIVGDGSQRKELEELARSFEIEDIVHFTGFCADPSPIFNITDLNVNCSYGTETSSLALSEGMSLGIPAVASDYGGNPHMVKNAVNGLIFPARNAEALAMAIIRLYRDASLYSKCSLGALRRYKEEFTAKVMTDKMMELYKKEYAKTKK